MGTTIRPEISKKNRYWIDKHRYYELKHFCLQYPTWKKAHSSLDSMVRFAYDAAGSSRTNKIQRPVEDTVIAREYYAERMSIVEATAKETDEDLWKYYNEKTNREDDKKDELKDRIFKWSIGIAELMLPMMFYAIWMKRGFEFERTGTYTSTTFRGLFNNFKPVKK